MTCIIADTGPLIALAKLSLLDLPKRAFGSAAQPQTVHIECMAQSRHQNAEAIQQAIEDGRFDVLPDAAWPLDIPTPRLDAGEIAALALAIQMSEPVLIDEMRGRLAAARLAVPVFGTCGLLLIAKRAGWIDNVKSRLDTLRAEGYFISLQLRAEVLAAAGEA